MAMASLAPTVVHVGGCNTPKSNCGGCNRVLHSFVNYVYTCLTTDALRLDNTSGMFIRLVTGILDLKCPICIQLGELEYESLVVPMVEQHK